MRSSVLGLSLLAILAPQAETFHLSGLSLGSITKAPALSFVSTRLPALSHAKRSNCIGPRMGLLGTEQAIDEEEYTIIPSQLADSGGGWTIKATKPPPRQGTVWSRPRPQAGEVKTMGTGSFGTIYLGRDLKTGKEVAVKAEPDIGQKFSPLRAEADTLINLQGGPGIPDVYWLGKRSLAGKDSHILVMELLGPDMEDLLELLNTRSLSEKTCLMISHQMIECLRHIHEKGIIHRDIKPENFLMGVGAKANKVYLIDYGLSDYYVDEESNHLPERKGPDNLRGTLRYASIHKHKGLEQSRRDDVEELMYVIVYLMKGPLPWQSAEARTFDGLETGKWQRQRQMNKVKDMKIKSTPANLCQGLPDEIAELVAYSRELGFEEEPDYEWMKQMIIKAMESKGYAMDYEFDWGNKAAPKKKKFGLF